MTRNGTPSDGAATLDRLIDGAAARWPTRTALVIGEDSWTFERLRERVHRAAAAFRARGIGKGDCVAIVLRNSPEFIVAYFGLARIGAVAVPINFLVTKPEELRFMLDDCSAAGVVTQQEFLKGLLAARKALPKLKSVWTTDGAPADGVESFAAFVDGAPAEPAPAPAARAGDVAAILYTSGTTGTPKGVMLTHANIHSNCEASREWLGVTHKDVALTILPMFHTFAWTGCVLVSLSAGAKNVISPAIAPATPWLKQMGKHGVSVFAAVPPVYSVIAKEACGFKKFVLRYWFFRKVRFCISGAAPLGVETAKAFQAAMRLPILEGYGLTETSPVATINPPGGPRAGSVGKAIPDVRLRIIADDETPLPVGQEGEVCIQGPNIMLGYHNKPDATKETFTKDGWFKSGDIGVLDEEGYLYLRDRKKDMIIVKGLKVFSAQVEQVIAAHPDVEEVALIGIPGPDADELIKAFIVLRKGSSATKSELMQFCRQKLDAYKRPRDIEIIDSLPKNALQKVLKRVLRQRELEKA
ncbi:MAG: long-chain-fatty-acid--CoA ligase [Elusimicrobia bacterium]|nr:long-chain-fatty-acid--CoA ligase [Elusimicrobiota bacterium]